jgi:molecular chaperone Hsp33
MSTDAKVTNIEQWKKEHGDYLVRGTAAHGQIRCFAAKTTGLVEEARNRHKTSPVCTAALGRLMTAGSMMGAMLKGKDDLLTLTIRGNGPMQGLQVTADSASRVKGYVFQPFVWNEPKYAGKLDVGGAVGAGTLTVVRDQEFGDPYSSQIRLVSGEIAEDLTEYFAVSEQVPSSVGLGVLLNTDQTVRCAGGFIIQLMPGCEDATIDKLEARLSKVHSVTQMLDRGMTPEEMLEHLFEGMDLEILDTVPTAFSCNCSRERVRKVLISTGSRELQSMIDDGKAIEIECHFCGEKYSFEVDELREILEAAREKAMREIHVFDSQE